MSDHWGAIDPESWNTVPNVSGRVATESDVAAGAAVFYVDGQSEPADYVIPSRAYQSLDSGAKVPVVVVQAELTNESKLILGVRYLDGGNGVCTHEEIRPFNVGEPHLWGQGS